MLAATLKLAPEDFDDLEADQRLQRRRFFDQRADVGTLAKDISCTGTMIDVDIDARMDFPYAVVYEQANARTCMLDRGPAGHDPLRGVCNVGERRTISGPYKRQVRETYILKFMGRKVHVEGKRD